MSKIIRPTGIIRTLPSLYGNASIGARRYQQSISMLEREEIPAIYIALAQIPKIDVLHIYLLTDGIINIRLNIAGFENGGDMSPIKCWDEAFRQPKVWVICSAPVSRPLEPIYRRGFQGFRYTEDLW